MTQFARIATPAGTLFATAANGAITGLYFEDQKYFPSTAGAWREDPNATPLAECAVQVREYFEARRTSPHRGTAGLAAI